MADERDEVESWSKLNCLAPCKCLPYKFLRFVASHSTVLSRQVVADLIYALLLTKIPASTTLIKLFDL